MPRFRPWTPVFLLAAMCWFADPKSFADEGMWLFNDLPRAYLKDKHGFEPSRDWARHVMLSSVRFNSGGSASFVSSRGLVLTNHHVAADTLQKISTADKNFYRDGFLAHSLEDEVPAPDLELNQLVSMQDVTERVNAAVMPGMSPGDAYKARRAVMAEIEKESLDQTSLRSDVVTLYGGAKYHLYRYKKYTDVRLVWAPEAGIAFFGGDPDNFEYPRYCLDVSLMRVYEHGKPASIEHFLQWSPDGVHEGELVFVSGHPGRTRRIYTTAALKHLRDQRMPYVLDQLRRLEILLQQYSHDGAEQERRAREELFSVQNARKANMGMLQGLQSPALIASKMEQECKLLEKLKQNGKLRGLADAWVRIAEAQQRRGELIGQFASFGSRYYEIAEQLVLMAAEDQKPSAERLREYRDSARESLEQQLFSPAPIYQDLEHVKLADSLAHFAELRGGDEPLVQNVLAGKGPAERATQLISGTQLGDVAVRKALAEGGQAAIESSNDPMIHLARLMEPELRRIREVQDELDELERQAYADIAKAAVALQETSSYPDATFTLRLAFGVVQGYEADGQRFPAWTTIGGAFARAAAHGCQEPWALPTLWQKSKGRLDLSTPLNFVSTVDIIGGNSGSPVINGAGELVGVIFDGNIESLTADFYYSDAAARAIAVHSSAIREALEKIYSAEALAHELGR